MCGSPSLSCASVGRQKYLERNAETPRNSRNQSHPLTIGVSALATAMVSPVKLLLYFMTGMEEWAMSKLASCSQCERSSGTLDTFLPLLLTTPLAVTRLMLMARQATASKVLIFVVGVAQLRPGLRRDCCRVKEGPCWSCLLPTRTGLTLEELVRSQCLSTQANLHVVWAHTDPRSQVR